MLGTSATQPGCSKYALLETAASRVQLLSDDENKLE